jgi:hypothetical protein
MVKPYWCLELIVSLNSTEMDPLATCVETLKLAGILSEIFACSDVNDEGRWLLPSNEKTSVTLFCCARILILAMMAKRRSLL